jgi:hypothetical protein
MPTVSETMLDLYMTLYSDEAKCLSALNESSAAEQGDEHYCRRSFIRAACSVIEGAIFCLKDAALNTFGESEHMLSAAERALLREESYKLNDNGKAMTRPSFIPITSNIIFAFTMYARAHKLDYALILGDGGWIDFRGAVKIRNRLMHPKGLEDLMVSEDEQDVVAAASIWVGRNLVTILKQCNPSLADKLCHFEKQLDAIERLRQRSV